MISPNVVHAMDAHLNNCRFTVKQLKEMDETYQTLYDAIVDTVWNPILHASYQRLHEIAELYKDYESVVAACYFMISYKENIHHIEYAKSGAYL